MRRWWWGQQIFNLQLFVLANGVHFAIAFSSGDCSWQFEVFISSFHLGDCVDCKLYEALFEAAGFAVKGVKRLWQTGEGWTVAWEVGLGDPFLKSAEVLSSGV